VPVTIREFTTSVTKMPGLFRLRMYLAEEMWTTVTVAAADNFYAAHSTGFYVVLRFCST
jgi:hypothetical protein